MPDRVADPDERPTPLPAPADFRAEVAAYDRARRGRPLGQARATG